MRKREGGQAETENNVSEGFCFVLVLVRGRENNFVEVGFPLDISMGFTSLFNEPPTHRGFWFCLFAFLTFETKISVCISLTRLKLPTICFYLQHSTIKGMFHHAWSTHKF